MENCKLEKERQTLISVLEKLEFKCSQLSEVAMMTERLNEKLKRTEGQLKCEETMPEKTRAVELNIVELFNAIANKIGIQIDIIGKNTDNSMQMID